MLLFKDDIYSKDSPPTPCTVALPQGSDRKFPVACCNVDSRCAEEGWTPQPCSSGRLVTACSLTRSDHPSCHMDIMVHRDVGQHMKESGKHGGTLRF